MSQETLEEAVKTYYEENIDQSNIPREHYEWEIQDLMSGFAYKWQQENSNINALDFEIDSLKVLKHQQDKMYSEEDMRKSYAMGWITRERFDDLSPDIIYPKGIDYEEKQDYAFSLWFEQFKKK